MVNSEGIADIDQDDWLASMFGQFSILDRAFVVHAGEDDLGKGGNEGSLKTGNAGGRVGCGVIRQQDASVGETHWIILAEENDDEDDNNNSFDGLKLFSFLCHIVQDEYVPGVDLDTASLCQQSVRIVHENGMVKVNGVAAKEVIQKLDKKITVIKIKDLDLDGEESNNIFGGEQIFGKSANSGMYYDADKKTEAVKYFSFYFRIISFRHFRRRE